MVDLVIPARRRDLGGGLEVGRVLPFARRRMVGPFIFLDHMGPARFSPGQGIDVRPHPHVCLATVTYLFDGEIFHRDSLGSAVTIRPGEVNWMTAGRGIVHSERTDAPLRATGQNLHGIQTWVALPNGAEEVAPAFAHYDADALPRYTDSTMSAVLIAGEAYGLKSPVVTSSPLFYVDLTLAPGTRMALPGEYEDRAAYIVGGRVTAGTFGYERGQMLVFGKGPAEVVAAGGPARLILLGGAPIGERHIWWNFVASSEERIEQAKADWREGRMTLPPGDDQEFIPLPDAPAPRATPPL